MSGDGNVAAEAVVHKGVAHVEGVHFDLVHSRLHTCLEPKVMQEHQREVADTDGANFFLIDQLLHGSPRVNEWRGAELGTWTEVGFVEAGVVHSHGEVDQVQIQVLHTQVIARLLIGLWHYVNLVVRIPQLSNQEEVSSGHDLRLKGFL